MQPIKNGTKFRFHCQQGAKLDQSAINNEASEPLKGVDICLFEPEGMVSAAAISQHAGGSFVAQSYEAGVQILMPQCTDVCVLT